MSDLRTTGWVRIGQREGRGKVCPICGHKDACTVTRDGAYAVCLRVSDGCCTRADGQPIEAKNGMGWLHAIKGKAGAMSPGKTPDPKDPSYKLTAPECKDRQKSNRTAISPNRLVKLATRLGLSRESLEAYGIGWDCDYGAWSWPMYDGRQRVCGFRLRDDAGNKYAVRGSTNGLFIPADYDDSAIPHEAPGEDGQLLLLLPEGPTDAGAARMLGFRAIGRPSNIGGAAALKELLGAGHPQDVVIVADLDETKFLPGGEPYWPGWEGSLATGNAILPICQRLRIIKPPDMEKDLRSWLNRGNAQAEVLHQIVKNADRVNRAWLNAKAEEVKVWKRKLWRKQA